MAENEKPQHLTKEEFDAGVKFWVDTKTDPLCHLDWYYNEEGTIRDKHGDYYCSVLYKGSDGFVFIDYKFGYRNEARIYFENCFKLPKK